ncbi:MAG: hypothetical protein HYS56_06390 [Candidatus Omnitrophica bacterium]|nr:hypothetical protein [Candidatus Omnitrophota bacterium]
MEITRGKRADILIYSILFFTGLASMGLALSAFSSSTKTHQILVRHWIPQYQAVMEMERAARQDQRAEFLAARAQLLEWMAPDQDLSFIEAVTTLPRDAGIIGQQITPQIQGTIQRLLDTQKTYLDLIWVGFLAMILLGSMSFGGLALSYWRDEQQENQWGGFYRAALPPAHRLSAALGQLQGNSRQLTEQTERTVQHSRELIELTDQLQSPLNQIEGILGLAHDTTKMTSRNTTEMAQQLKQTQDKLLAASAMMRGMVERTERMRVLAEGLSDLADQANLFLVNTSIEVAREGEKGRGFASVAEEVSHLADGSVKTSQELIHLVRNINDEAARAASSLQQEIGSFAATHQIVAKGEQSFADLSRMIQHLCEQSSCVQQGFGRLFLHGRSLKETSADLAQSQRQWQQWLTASSESIEQMTSLLQDIQPR